jgi:site-specific DNA-methyltransferase (adenine-specific)
MKQIDLSLPVYNKKIINSEVSLFKKDVINFLKSLPEKSIDIIVTDPAYSGMNNHLSLGKGRIIGKYSERGSKKGKWFHEFLDSPENYISFLRECNRVLKEESHIFIMFDSYSLISLSSLVREVFDVKNIIVWDKVNIGMGHYFRRRSELIIFASKGRKKLSSKSIPDIWTIKRVSKLNYPTQKPTEIFQAMISASTGKDTNNLVVCDPFLGSGSSCIAAIKQGSNFIGNDLTDKAIQLSIDRVDAYHQKGIDILQKKSLVPEGMKIWW